MGFGWVFFFFQEIQRPWMLRTGVASLFCHCSSSRGRGPRPLRQLQRCGVREEEAPFPGPFSDPPLASTSMSIRFPTLNSVCPNQLQVSRSDGGAPRAGAVKADALRWIPGTHVEEGESQLHECSVLTCAIARRYTDTHRKVSEKRYVCFVFLSLAMEVYKPFFW